MSVDALVLAGDRTGYIPVEEPSKALIMLNGKPIVEYVIDALLKARMVGDIHIVGPAEKLSGLPSAGSMTIHGQYDNVVDNVINTYKSICPSGDRHILVITSDIPFVQPVELDAFISEAQRKGSDIVLGYAREACMSRFYARNGKPGIRMSYTYLRQETGRVNNLFLVNPARAIRPELAAMVYRFRYQKKLRNIAGLILEILRRDVNRREIIQNMLLLQAALQADHYGLFGLAHRIGRLVDLGRIEAIASRAIGANISAVFMDWCGAALDIDNEESLDAARERFGEFMELAGAGHSA